MKTLKRKNRILWIALIISIAYHVIFGIWTNSKIEAYENELYVNEISSYKLLNVVQAYSERNVDLLAKMHEDRLLFKQFISTPIIRDIPLSDSLQIYTHYLCNQNGLDYELVLAVMDCESDYTEYLISPTNDFGLMQINAVNHKWLSQALDIHDFLDAEQNIKAGIYILKDLFNKYEDTHKVLMAYNHGEYGAQQKWQQGICTSGYSEKVMRRAKELKEVK